MKAITTPLLLALLGAASPGVLAQAVNPTATLEDRQNFSDLYGDKLAAVDRTRAGDDDKELALEMIAFSNEIPDDEGVQRLIYIEVIRLAANGADIDLMRAAAVRLELLSPGHDDIKPEHLIDLADRAYRSTPRTERDEVAEQYIDLLLSSAEDAEAQDQIKQALVWVREAQSTARAVGSDKRGVIDDRIERLSRINTLINRIEMLTLSVQKNPQNRPAARELVDLLVIKRNDPIAAIEFGAQTGDPDLAEVLGMFAQGVEQANAPAAMRVGDWFVALAQEENDELAEPLLERARRWYERFFALYPRRDALATRVRSQDQVAELRLSRIADDRGEGAVIDTKWTNLIEKTFDPFSHMLTGEVRMRESEIHVDPGSFALPITPKDEFDLRIKVSVNDIPDGKSIPVITVYMPLGENGITCRYNLKGRLVAYVHGTRSIRMDDDRKPMLFKPIEMVFSVRKAKPKEEEPEEDVKGKYTFRLSVDGKTAVWWRGRPDEVEPGATYTPPERLGNVFRIECSSEAIFHTIALSEDVHEEDDDD